MLIYIAHKHGGLPENMERAKQITHATTQKYVCGDNTQDLIKK